MSIKTNNLSFSKSLFEKTLNNRQRRINIKNVNLHSLKKKQFISKSYDKDSILSEIISKNLQKYKTTKKQYETFIINSIIFDQKNHKVAVFKNYLLWDEMSEFLKRFYKMKESKDRIPKISEYYEKYTLFAPIYFGLDGLVILIMNKWTKRKKNYLEYVEDHEYESSIKSKKESNFEPIIKSSLINELSPTKSLVSKNTLDLTKYEIESSSKKNKSKEILKSLVFNKEFTIQKIESSEMNKIKIKKKFEEIDIKKSLSFSEILDDLSSNYSVLENIHKKNMGKKINKNSKNIKLISKKNKIITNKTTNNSKIKNSLSKNINKPNNFCRNFIGNKSCSINNMSKNKNKNIVSSYIPSVSNSRQKKIGLIKKKKIEKFNTNNCQNLAKKSNDLLPKTQKFDYKILNTEGLSQKHQGNTSSNQFFNNINNIYNKKCSIKVHSSTNFLTDRNEVGRNKNRIIDRMQKNTIISNNLLEDLSKKNTFISCSGNVIGSMTERNYSGGRDRILINLKSKNKVVNCLRKNKNNIAYNIINNNINSDSDSNNSCKPFLTHNRNSNNYKSLCYLYEKPNKKNLDGRMIINNITKKTLNRNDNNKICVIDPLAYKLLQISNKKKKICLTTINSLRSVQEATNRFVNTCNNSNTDSSTNKTNEKLSTFNSLNSINYRKKLVLNQLTKKEIIYDNKKKLISQGINSGSLTYRGNSSSSTMKKRFINLNIPDKNSGFNTFREGQKSSQKINLNLNLNIHFDIDVTKNGTKKLIFNNAIINQQQNGNIKYPNTSTLEHEKNVVKSVASPIRNNDLKKINKCSKNYRIKTKRLGKK